MFETWYIVIALAGSLFCGLWDLKTSDIPDSICSLMISLGIGLHGLESYLIGSSAPIISSFTVGGLFLVFGIIMYYTGQWGGGDGELLTAIGFLLPTASVPTFFSFPMTFFINMIFVGAIYSVIYFLVLIKQPGVKRKGFDVYRKISTKKLKKGDVIGEDIPRLKLYKRKIRGLTEQEVSKIRRIKKYTIVREGIRYGLVFPIALAITLYFGDLILYLV